MSEDPLECSICLEHYNDTERKPRYLTCGHTFCSSCITSSIRSSVFFCPICRTHNPTIVRAEDVPVNYSLLGMLSGDFHKTFSEENATSTLVNNVAEEASTNEGKIDEKVNTERSSAACSSRQLSASSSFPNAEEVLPSALALEPEISAGICHEHGSHLLFRCSLCKVFICSDCTVVYHPVSRCTIIPIKYALQEMKNEVKADLRKILSTCDDNLARLGDLQGRAEDDRRRLEEQLTLLEAPQRRATSSIMSQQEKVRILMNEGRKHRQAADSLHRRLEASTNLQELEDTRQDAHVCKRNTSVWVMTSTSANQQTFDTLCKVKEMEKLVSLASSILSIGNGNEDINEIKEGTDSLDFCQPSKAFGSGASACSSQCSDGESAAAKPLGEYSQSFSLEDGGMGASLKTFEKRKVIELLLLLLRSVICLEEHQGVSGRVWGVIHEEGNRWRHSPLSLQLQQGLFFLHALRDGVPPPMGVTMPYKRLRSLWSDYSTKVFLELSWDTALQGCAIVRVNASTNWGSQFISLCSGERGPSYRGSLLLSVIDKGQPGERLLMGDYELNNGKGGAALRSDLMEDKGEVVNISEGLVFGRWGAATGGQFVVYLKENPGKQRRYPLGIVESGMEVLQAFSAYPGKASISDCGLVMHL